MDEKFRGLMLYFIVICIGLGLTLQAGLNRNIAADYGFPISAMMNNLVIFSVSLIFVLGLIYFYNGSSPVLKFQIPGFAQLKWWWFIPGLCGFAAVFGSPYMISQIGAAKVFICLISGQLLGALLWDLLVEKIQIPFMRALGIVLSFIGALCVVLSKTK